MRRSLLSQFPLAFFTVYLAMVSNAFYLVFVDLSDVNNVGKASESQAYVAIWLTLYVVLIGAIALIKPLAIPKTWIFGGILTLTSVAAYVTNGVEISSIVKLVSLVLTILFGGWAADRFSSDRVLSIFFSLAVVLTVVHLLLYPLLANADFAVVYDRLQRNTLLGTTPYAGIFPHKNLAATFFVQAIVIGVGMALSPGGKWTAGLFVRLGIFMVALLLSGAVSPILSGALSVAVMFVGVTYQRAPAIAGLVGVVVAAVIVALVVFPDTWLELFNRDDTFTGRTYLYESWYSYFRAQPIFGYGYGEAFNGTDNSLGEALNAGTGLWYSRYQNFESGFLQALIEFGLIGGATYAAAFYFAGRYAVRAVTDGSVSYALVPLGVFTYCLVSSLNEVPIVVPNTTTLFLLSFLSAKYALQPAGLKVDRRPGGRNRPNDRRVQARGNALR
ncbi:O-antigen ligase family protein [Novosphingobium sp.]|uniref:O-antigen ligase family protein n=1 Tax=Novosphingobium sp. TaxID=1874826 RepID=UPI003BA9D22F